jgi:hypothetical protein
LVTAGTESSAVGTIVLSGFTSLEANLMGAVGIITLDGIASAIDAHFPSVLTPERTIIIYAEVRVLNIGYEDRVLVAPPDDRVDTLLTRVITV